MTAGTPAIHADVQAERDACRAAQTTVLRLAEAAGAGIRECPIMPGSVITTRLAEPLAGIRAARLVERSALRMIRDYIRYARQEGVSWPAIGEAVGIGEHYGELASAAFQYAAGPATGLSRPLFAFRCGACELIVTDYGPYESHPEDNEHGHAPDCPRMTAVVAAWQADCDAP